MENLEPVKSKVKIQLFFFSHNNINKNSFRHNNIDKHHQASLYSPTCLLWRKWLVVCTQRQAWKVVNHCYQVNKHKYIYVYVFFIYSIIHINIIQVYRCQRWWLAVYWILVRWVRILRLWRYTSLIYLFVFYEKFKILLLLLIEIADKTRQSRYVCARQCCWCVC